MNFYVQRAFGSLIPKCSSFFLSQMPALSAVRHGIDFSISYILLLEQRRGKIAVPGVGKQCHNDFAFIFRSLSQFLRRI